MKCENTATNTSLHVSYRLARARNNYYFCNRVDRCGLAFVSVAAISAVAIAILPGRYGSYMSSGSNTILCVCPTKGYKMVDFNMIRQDLYET